MQAPKCWLLILLFIAATNLDAAAEPLKQIVLIAGPKSHGPEGNRIHDYPWSVRLLQTMLEHSNIREQIRVHAFLNGWPSDRDVLRQADTIMIISDGRDGDLGNEALHLATPQRIAFIDSLVARGCGVVAFHFSTFAPDALSDRALNWVGGYFDWETDGRRAWYSDIKTMEAQVTKAADQHPILRGVGAFRIQEEFYFDIRFLPDDPRWTPIWRVDALPAQRPHGKIVSWAIEQESGSRGFATTCGHFYDNWKEAHFRKTVLNALAWTAHVTVPQGGIESAFFERDNIAAHLRRPDLIGQSAEPEDDPRYAESPYWYKPGHPSHPAEARAIKTLPGFKASRVLTVPDELGSWTALCTDNRGRLLAAAQHLPGLHRITVPPPESESAVAQVEQLTGVAQQVGWSHGLLYAFDSLYVTVSEAEDEADRGVYRLRDTTGDDQYDSLTKIIPFTASGEHSAHNIVVGPESESLYMICGNGTKLPADLVRRRPVTTTGLDHLVPLGFGTSRYTPAGFVLKFSPDGSDIELVAAGLRNSFDLAFNQIGDLFTFDSDMEWDLGAPWYRPTRICHLVSGAEFGWRGDTAKWPEHYEDSVAPVINIGPASPAGVAFGYQTRFPNKYQQALFACDWTFATIHAVHLKSNGAGYTASVEEFVGGQGLPMTDITVGGDGALYFAVGGRKLGSAIYRVHYEGDSIATQIADEPAGGHAIRRRLERFHGVRHKGAVAAAWPYLGDADRGIRFAARVAVESQAVDHWRDAVFAETDLTTKVTALLALVRQGENGDLHRVVRTLNAFELAKLTLDDLLKTLRIYELALARGGDSLADEHTAIQEKLRPLLAESANRQRGEVEDLSDRNLQPAANRELSRLLCHLRDTASIDLILRLMELDAGTRPPLGASYFDRNEKYGEAVQEMLQAAPLVDRMHHAQMLVSINDGWSEVQRRRYFELIQSATRHSRGGYWYAEFWNRIQEAALESIPAERRAAYEAMTANRVEVSSDGLPQAIGPGREWTLDEAVELLEKGWKNRDFANGKKMFSAARCVTCHRFRGEGSATGPDLSTIAQRFTLRDLLDSTIHPSKAVSDQYRVHLFMTSDGRTLTGRVVSRDTERVQLATNLLRPSETTVIDLASIDEELPVPVSTMPTKLLDSLNGDEVLDLLAYLISGNDPAHPLFEQ